MLTNEEFYQSIADNIRKHQRMVLGVIGTHAYTIGNHLRGIPELVLVGPFDSKTTSWVLNELSGQMIAQGRVFESGVEVHLGGQYPVCILAASDDAKSELTIQASRFFQHEDYDVMQVVLCDPQGRFPWHAECDRVYNVKVYRRASH